MSLPRTRPVTGNPARLDGPSARVLPSRSESGRTVLRAVEGGKAKAAWQSNIIELAEGRSLDEIAAILYSQELARGASEAYMALLQRQFAQDVAETVDELVGEGYLRRELLGVE